MVLRNHFETQSSKSKYFLIYKNNFSFEMKFSLEKNFKKSFRNSKFKVKVLSYI
nr:MAG TPA: hypothetical protein [Caudoviricetes sp.]